MKRRILTGSTALLLIGLTVLSVFCYNYWSYCCGRCTASTFLTLGPFGLTLLGLDVLAGAVLSILKIRRLKLPETRCRCGTNFSAGWSFCPDCGKPCPEKHS